jgi:hypothetical protein
LATCAHVRMIYSTEATSVIPRRPLKGRTKNDGMESAAVPEILRA